jgi:hypothetical protein
MENSREMHILGKYKYLRFLNKKIENVVQQKVLPQQSFNLTNTTKVQNPPTQQKEMTDKEKKQADKLAKKQKMLELCKPKNNKPAYVAKEKYLNDTPWGEKKGKNNLIKINFVCRHE